MPAETAAGAAPWILEVGHYCLFKRVCPARTHWIFTGKAAEVGDARPDGGMESLTRELANPRYGLVVCFASPMDRRGWRARLTAPFRPGNRPIPDLDRVLARARLASPLAVLDMEDHAEILSANVRLLEQCTAYFKRELSPDVAASLGRRGDRLRPISLGLSAQRLAALPREPVAKTVDVFFAGATGRGYDLRERGIAQLERLARMGYRVEVASGLPLTEYMRRLASAWLVWSPPGFGTDCFRHYEALACGSVPLLNRSPWARHRPLLEGHHCIYYDPDQEDLADVAAAALADKERLAAMVLAGQPFVLEHHTHAALCRYIEQVTLGTDRR